MIKILPPTGCRIQLVATNMLAAYQMNISAARVCTIMARSIIVACLAVALFIAVAAVSGCTSYGGQKSLGFLSGKVTVGPLTPVERVGVTPPMPDPSVFTSRHLLLLQADGKTLVHEIAIQPAGYYGIYNVSLAPGNYVLDYQMQRVGGAKGLPATVTIEAGKTTTLDVDIDTGIR